MIRFLMTSLYFFLVYSVYSQTIDVKNWITDIQVYQTKLEENHIDLYHSISKKEFEQELQQIKVGLNQKTDTEVIIDLMRLTRKIGDGHTAFSLRNLETHVFPIEIYYVDKQWRVIKTTTRNKALLGKTLVEIDGKPMEEIAKEVSKVAQYVENEQSQIIRAGNYAMISEILYGLQFTKNKLNAVFSFVGENGEETKVALDAINNKTYSNQTNFQSYSMNSPVIEKPTNSPHDYLWFGAIKETKAIYIKFESYPSFEEMERFGGSTLKYIHKNKIKQVVIDLRNNGGGDFFVGTFLAYYLNLADSIDWKSGVYVLTDKVTFSAATSNASQFRQMLNAKIIGEPSGSNPNGYQDMGQFTLPNSKMIVTYSKRLFRFQQKATQGVQPDVLIEYDWQSYSNGIDNMMEWVVRDIKKNMNKQ